MQDGRLAVAPQWVNQFVDEGVVDCREELRLECDLSLAVSAEFVVAAVVECVGRTDLGGRGIHTMGFLDARIGGWDECGVGKDCLLFGRNVCD